MEKDGIVFVGQLLDKLERDIQKLEVARRNNDPREFSEAKKLILDTHKEIEGLLK